MLADGPIIARMAGETRRTLRRAMGWSVALGALLIVALVAERLWQIDTLRTAHHRQSEAQALAAEMQRVSERMTQAARLAVATGERRFVDDYDQLRLQFDATLGRVRQAAPGAASETWDERTRHVLEELVDMQESAFEAVTVGAAETARAIFDGERYRDRSLHMAKATETLASDLVTAAEARYRGVTQRALVFGAGTLVLGVLLGGALWVSVQRQLRRSGDLLQQTEDRIQRLAATDLLTGLPSRAWLHEALPAAVAAAAAGRSRLAVMMIDLDRFKPINDRHGHAVGDQVLAMVAQRLRAVVRAHDLTARYGGDEFVLALPVGMADRDVLGTAERIVAALQEPMPLAGLQLQVGASVGVAFFPEHGASAEDLLRRADSAAYRAKALGRNRACAYEPALDGMLAERATLEQELREGLARGEFVPHYQPVVSLHDDRVQSVELLCRWQHPRHGLLGPDRFIALAEMFGLIGPLTVQLLHQACRDMAHMPAHWRVSLNVAPQQLQDATLVPKLTETLQAHGVAPHRLDIELTETALVGDLAAARQVMDALKAHGMTVTLDDFGTGYSSLSYLAELHFDRVKIDRRFIKALRHSASAARVVEAIVGLSRSLGLVTVAEGVETEADRDRLKAMGCAMAQGYLFARPLPIAELLASRWTAPPHPVAAPGQAPSREQGRAVLERLGATRGGPAAA